MDHVAIMKKSWGFLDKIKSGQKTIESRWYQTRRVPWGKITRGETVYFKNSGEPVTVKAKVKRVEQYESLIPMKVEKLLNKYGQPDGIAPEDLSHFVERFGNKRYCILVFLQDVKGVRPFQIDKTSFGLQTAWISVPNIDKIKSHA